MFWTGVITHQMTQTHDELGRLLKQIGANTQETRYGYEKNDNLKTVTDPRNEVNSYTYDAVNRLLRMTSVSSSWDGLYIRSRARWGQGQRGPPQRSQ